jgi:hypothetical protein
MNNFFRAAQTLIGFVALSACASGPPSTQTQVDRVVVSTDAGDIRSYEGVPKVSVTVKAAPEAALVALRGAYEEIGVEDKLSAPGSNRVGNSYFSKTSRLGGAPLSRYLECGSTMTGPAADNFPITISLVSVVAPSGTGSTIETLLSARTGGASSSSGTSNCRTLGTLEMRLNRILVRRLGE